MGNDKLAHLGRGWGFPPTFSKEDRGVKLVENEENIAKSVKLIVLTTIGERVYHPTLGTNINDFAFTRNIQYVNDNKLRRMVEFAIAENEFRVDVDNVDIAHNTDDNCIEISVAYTIKALNTKYNMVFPFYLEKGIKG